MEFQLSYFKSLKMMLWTCCTQFSSVQLLVVSDSLRSHESQHAGPPLSVTNSRSSLRLTSIESVMPSSHLILCRPLFLLPPIPPSIRIFSNESTLCMRWPKYSSFSFSIIPSKEYPEYASKFGKLSSGHRTGKGQFSFQSKESQWQRIFKLLHNCTHLTQVMLRILQARLVYEQRNFRCSTWI